MCIKNDHDEGKGREGKGREGKEGKGREGKGREGKGREGRGKERKRKGKAREGKGRKGKARERKARQGRREGTKQIFFIPGSCGTGVYIADHEVNCLTEPVRWVENGTFFMVMVWL